MDVEMEVEAAPEAATATKQEEVPPPPPPPPPPPAAAIPAKDGATSRAVSAAPVGGDAGGKDAAGGVKDGRERERSAVPEKPKKRYRTDAALLLAFRCVRWCGGGGGALCRPACRCCTLAALCRASPSGASFTLLRNEVIEEPACTATSHKQQPSFGFGARPFFPSPPSPAAGRPRPAAADQQQHSSSPLATGEQAWCMHHRPVAPCSLPPPLSLPLDPCVFWYCPSTPVFLKVL